MENNNKYLSLLETFKVNQLKDILKTLDLPSEGVKANLKLKIQEALEKIPTRVQYVIDNLVAEDLVDINEAGFVVQSETHNDLNIPLETNNAGNAVGLGAIRKTPIRDLNLFDSPRRNPVRGNRNNKDREIEYSPRGNPIRETRNRDREIEESPRTIFRRHGRHIRDREIEWKFKRMTTVLGYMDRNVDKFDGSSDSECEEFLNKINEIKEMFDLTDQEVLPLIPEYLRGMTLEWYRCSKNEWATLREFDRVMSRRYIDLEKQGNLMCTIEKRFQHPQEGDINYITYMKSLFNRVISRISLDRQLKNTIKQLLPKIYLAVADYEIITWSELENIVIKKESDFKQTANYTLPPPPDKSSFPNLMYKQIGKPKIDRIQLSNLTEEFVQNMSEINLEEKLDNKQDLNVQGNKRIFRCYKCGDTDHLIKDCRNPRRIFCKNCGTKGRLTNECQCQRPKDLIFCRKCGRLGYTTDNCKDCKENE